MGLSSLLRPITSVALKLSSEHNEKHFYWYDSQRYTLFQEIRSSVAIKLDVGTIYAFLYGNYIAFNSVVVVVIGVCRFDCFPLVLGWII